MLSFPPSSIHLLVQHFLIRLFLLQHVTTVIPNFAHDQLSGGDDTVLPPFQLGDELAENALNTDSTTPQAWR